MLLPVYFASSSSCFILCMNRVDWLWDPALRFLEKCSARRGEALWRREKKKSPHKDFSREGFNTSQGEAGGGDGGLVRGAGGQLAWERRCGEGWGGVGCSNTGLELNYWSEKDGTVRVKFERLLLMDCTVEIISRILKDCWGTHTHTISRRSLRGSMEALRESFLHLTFQMSTYKRATLDEEELVDSTTDEIYPSAPMQVHTHLLWLTCTPLSRTHTRHVWEPTQTVTRPVDCQSEKFTVYNVVMYSAM